MEPSLTAEVTTNAAYSATGFDLDTTIPQTYNNPQGLATSTLKEEVVTLPEGMTVNPSSGAGLVGVQRGAVRRRTAAEPTAKAKEEGHGCPNSSKLATVRIKTPSISEEVTGSVYLAEPRAAWGSGQEPVQLVARAVSGRARPRSWCARQGAGARVAEPGNGPDHDDVRATPEFDGIPASPGLPPLPASDISSHSTRARTPRS